MCEHPCDCEIFKRLFAEQMEKERLDEEKDDDALSPGDFVRKNAWK